MTFDAQILNAILQGNSISQNRHKTYKRIKNTWNQAAVAIILKTKNKSTINIPPLSDIYYHSLCDQNQLSSLTKQHDFQCEMLICQRAKNEKDIHQGELCFPGGKLEIGEGDFVGVLRETQEEVGLNLRYNTLYLGRLPNNFKIEDTKRKMYLCAHIFLIIDESPQLTLNKSEIQGYQWIPISYFCNLENKIMMEKLNKFYMSLMITEMLYRFPQLAYLVIKQCNYVYVPLIDVQMNHPLMGFTHFLLVQFFNLAIYMDDSILKSYPSLEILSQTVTLQYCDFNTKSPLGYLADKLFSKLYIKYLIRDRVNVKEYVPKL